jgi:hypothetical protein
MCAVMSIKLNCKNDNLCRARRTNLGLVRLFSIHMDWRGLIQIDFMHYYDGNILYVIVL